MFRDRAPLGNIIEIFLILLYILAIVCFTLFFFNRFGGDEPDEPSGPNDIITEGDVKIDLIDPDNKDSLVGDKLPFVIPEDKIELHFEPGLACHTEPFIVHNNGKVAIDYVVSISDPGTKSCDEFKKCFTFWLTTDPTKPEAAESMLSYRGTLEPGQESPAYYLVVKMKPEIGNEYQGKTFESVGITVNAIARTDKGQE